MVFNPFDTVGMDHKQRGIYWKISSIIFIHFENDHLLQKQEIHLDQISMKFFNRPIVEIDQLTFNFNGLHVFKLCVHNGCDYWIDG